MNILFRLLILFYFQCTQRDDGSWTTCNGNCTCYHEEGKKDGLCLSTEYTDFTQYPNLTSAEIADATPRPQETNCP